MDELYLKHQDGDTTILTRDKDPFWDPVEDVFLGRWVQWDRVLSQIIHSISVENKRRLVLFKDNWSDFHITN